MKDKEGKWDNDIRSIFGSLETYLFLLDPALLFMLIIPIFVYRLLTGKIQVFLFWIAFFDVFFSLFLSGDYEEKWKEKSVERI